MTTQLNTCTFQCQHFFRSYLYTFSAVVHIMHFFGAIWDKFELIFFKLCRKLETEPSNDVI